jgi:multicomponent Na+:H+ antiporter subunit G
LNTIEEAISVAVGVIMLLGALFNVLAAFGIMRLPDVYTRSHAATKSATIGVIFILTGAFVFFWAAEGHVSVRLLLGIVFVFMTAPVAGHLIGRAAYRTKVPLWSQSVQDDLKPTLHEKDFRTDN